MNVCIRFLLKYVLLFKKLHQTSWDKPVLKEAQRESIPKGVASAGIGIRAWISKHVSSCLLKQRAWFIHTSPIILKKSPEHSWQRMLKNIIGSKVIGRFTTGGNRRND